MLGACGAGPSDLRSIPVIFDTDIGGDVDDTWALYYLLRCPQLDLKLVATEGSATPYRARLTAKLLQLAGRTDVPVSLGPNRDDWDGPQSEWIGDYQLTDYPGAILEDGVAAILAAIESSEEPVTVLSVGPAPVLAEAIRQRPEVFRNARLIGMFGSIDVGYGGAGEPVAEYNVVADPGALRTLLSAPWRDILLTPLDTCGLIVLDGEDYQRVYRSADPLARATIENYETWLPNVDWMPEGYDPSQVSSTLFDVLAVELAYNDSHVEIETLPITVTDEGMTLVDEEAGTAVRCAMAWRDLEGFEQKIARLLTKEA
nr:inosine-uridine preferring nucleoside hydrolase [Aquisalinus luteolus]